MNTCLLDALQVGLLTAAYNDMNTLAAAVTCSWAPRVAGGRASGQPVTLRAVVIAIMAANRLKWFASTGACSLGKPHALHARDARYVSLLAPQSKASQVSQGSWRRSFEQFLFMLPDQHSGDEHDAESTTSPVSDYLSALSAFDSDAARELLQAAASVGGTTQSLFRGLRAQTSKASRTGT